MVNKQHGPEDGLSLRCKPKIATERIAQGMTQQLAVDNFYMVPEATPPFAAAQRTACLPAGE